MPRLRKKPRRHANSSNSIIEDTSTPSDNVALAHIDGRIEAAITDFRRLLNEENSRLISQLEAYDFPEVQRSLKRIDAFRDEFNQKIDQIRADMLAQVYASAATVMGDQQRAIWITVIVTAIAAILGLLFAGLVGSKLHANRLGSSVPPLAAVSGRGWNGKFR